MRRLIAIYLTALFLFSALVPVRVQEELAKLPSLLEHYDEHLVQTPDLTFPAFLKLHYGEEAAKHHSDHDHSGLPGKDTCGHLHAPSMALLPIAAVSSQPIPATAPDRSVFSDQSYSFSLLNDIWQPPRV